MSLYLQSSPETCGFNEDVKKQMCYRLSPSFKKRQMGDVKNH